MSMSTAHPPDTVRPVTRPTDTAGLLAALPRLGPIDRIAVRLALRAILRLEARDRRAGALEFARELELARARTSHLGGVPRGKF